MRIPTIHLNGSGKKTLLSQVEQALEALQTAVTAMTQAAPNARDYYVQDSGAFETARAEHDSRIRRIIQIRQEYADLANGIFEQGGD